MLRQTIYFLCVTILSSYNKKLNEYKPKFRRESREKFTYSAYDMALKISSDRESFEEDFVREEKKNKSTRELPWTEHHNKLTILCLLPSLPAVEQLPSSVFL